MADLGITDFEDRLLSYEEIYTVMRPGVIRNEPSTEGRSNRGL